MITVATTLGSSVPPFTSHAISVSLPTWQDNVGYEEGDKRVIDLMVTGYPRFFIHRSVEKLQRICLIKFGINGERCMLFPTRNTANECRSFMADQSLKANAKISTRVVQFVIRTEDNKDKTLKAMDDAELYIVFFPANAFPLAKSFWQHAGMGISSRFADHCLAMLSEDSSPVSPRSVGWAPLSGKVSNKHYTAKENRSALRSETLTMDQNVYVEERYGRNLPNDSAAAAKRALRRRIADVHTKNQWHEGGNDDIELGQGVTEDDVFLYPGGMCSIWYAHRIALATRPPAKSAAFGFMYVDTVKILEKWGPGCHFFGTSLDPEIDDLEKLLETESSEPPLLAIFTEVPTNPLLRTANLTRLRALADKYDFLIVIDVTIGNYNVEVLPYADIIVTSLTKVFSGDANVMGGSLVFNPKRRHYRALKDHLVSIYEDIYYGEDAIYMERNSRDFKRRIRVIDENTEAVCDFLRSHSLAGNTNKPSPAIKEVFYPKWSARENYDTYRVKGPDGTPTGGFGGLFSLTFTSNVASRVFFDTLPLNKGPSLGTNFTLACPYTILAHFGELEWAAKFGVEEGLVRVSVGMENKEDLLKLFEKALIAAEVANC